MLTSRSQKIVKREKLPDAGMYQKTDTFGKDGIKVGI